MLAQSWLYGRRMTSPHDAIIEKHLRLPEQFNPHSSVAALNELAERIVFVDDVPSLLYEMHENRQLTYEGVLTSAKLPYDLFWIEYKSIIGIEGIEDLANAEYGALVKRMPNGRVRMYVVIGTKYHDMGVLSSLAYVVEFLEWPIKMVKPTVLNKQKASAIQFEILYAYNKERIARKEEEATDSVGGIVCELIFGIFLVTQPRDYSDEAVTWHPRKQASRRKHNKPPLLEYRRIRLRITKPTKRYSGQPTATRGIRITHEQDTESTDAVSHRRYHKVIGHFRHYNNHDPAYSVWIEPHYRGDPALGITFTERDVTK